jgi:hypothetical protein
LSSRINCRLPRTPRTPGTGVAHYSDDMFTQHVSQPKSSKPSLPRSSTSRSLVVRSDFDASINGDDEDGVRSEGNSVATDNTGSVRERNEANTYVAQYVSERLGRVRSHDPAVFENEDEYEAQLDGQ